MNFSIGMADCTVTTLLRCRTYGVADARLSVYKSSLQDGSSALLIRPQSKLNRLYVKLLMAPSNTIHPPPVFFNRRGNTPVVPYDSPNSSVAE